MDCTLGTLALQGLMWKFLIMLIFNELVKQVKFWTESVA